MQGVAFGGYITWLFQLFMVGHPWEQVANLIVELRLWVDQPLRQLFNPPKHDQESEGDQDEEDGGEDDADHGEAGEEGDAEVCKVLKALKQVSPCSQLILDGERDVLYNEHPFLKTHPLDLVRLSFNCRQLFLLLRIVVITILPHHIFT